MRRESEPLVHTLAATGCFVGLFAEYRRGQNICTVLGGAVALAVALGARLYLRLWSQSGLYSALTIICGYNMLLLRRRRRQLPPGLQGVKWIRLTYLASMMK